MVRSYSQLKKYDLNWMKIRMCKIKFSDDTKKNIFWIKNFLT